MNDRFFALPEEKQHAIINAGLRVFSRYDYKHASTDMIAQEAGISKGLLFHYFKNKRTFYLYLWDYSIDIMMKRMHELGNPDETDFFTILASTQIIKLNIRREYPDLAKFVMQVYLEKNEAVESRISEDYQAILAQSIATTFERVDVSKFKEEISLEQAINVVVWMSEGFVQALTPQELEDMEEVTARYLDYLDLLRHQFYRQECL